MTTAPKISWSWNSAKQAFIFHCNVTLCGLLSFSFLFNTLPVFQYFFIVFSILQEMKRISYKIQRSPFRYSIEILLLQASDHIATSYAELRDGSANAKV